MSVAPEKGKPTRKYQQAISSIEPLGREFRISPSASACVNLPGYSTKIFVPSVSVVIGIGKDHSAELLMTVEAWEAFKSGEKLDISSCAEFKKRFVNT